ncbi:MAG: isochorismate synthase [Pseudonocardiales bacterium]|nr:isochorismate synthase [Pseudonocardiales bacterium]MBV9031601.1 isochorismate synthase [Pseudonocardiales bacterium]MBW0009500.1 isochorismate synthase [Pseudonocardiales bacterium]
MLPSPHGALSWVRAGEGLVAWGEVARVCTEGPHRFARAQDWWQSFCGQLDTRDEVGLPGSGPVAFVSLAFDDSPGSSVLVVPRVVVGRRDDQTWVTEFETGVATRPVVPVSRPYGLRYLDGELPVTAWRDAVARAVSRMRNGSVPAKVVLAHDLLAVADEPLDPRFLLHGLAARYPRCWTFAVDQLVGATPELLLRRRGTEVLSRVLAGTTWPHDGANSGTLAVELLDSAKDRDEHRYAVDSLAQALRPFCTELVVPAAPSVLRLRNVLHLATEVRGVLHPEGPPLLTLADAVHPTAAVGGTPTPDAVRAIGELEAMDRGRYAGPVGWIDAAGDGELGIALRCAQIAGRFARLFAGCGIVAGSDPDSEVAEAAAKLVPIRDALEGS